MTEESTLCCPECDHCMPTEEWEKIKVDNTVVCPECEEEVPIEELLTGPDEDELESDEED